MGKRKQVFLLRVKFFRVQVFFTRSLSQMLVGFDMSQYGVSRESMQHAPQTDITRENRVKRSGGEVGGKYRNFGSVVL